MKYQPPANQAAHYLCNECCCEVHAPSVFNDLLYCKTCYFRLKLMEEALDAWERDGDDTFENYHDPDGDNG